MPKGPSKIKQLETSDILLINKYTGDVFQSDIRAIDLDKAEMSVHNEKGEKIWVPYDTNDFTKIDLKEEYKNLSLGDYIKHGQSQELLEGIVKQVYDVDLKEVYGYEKYNDDSYKNIKADYLNLQSEIREINNEVQSEFSKKNVKGDAEYIKLYATKLYEVISRPRVCDIARDVYVYKGITERGLTTAEALKQYGIEKEGNEIIEIKARTQSELEVAKANFEGASVEISAYKHYGANDMRTIMGSFMLPFIMRVAGRGLSLFGADYQTFKKRFPIGATLGQYKFIKNNIDHYKFARDEYISKNAELAKINDISSDVEKKHRSELNDIKNELSDLTKEAKDLASDVEKISEDKKELLDNLQNEKDKDKIADLHDKLDKVNDKVSELDEKKKSLEKKEDGLRDKYSKVEEKMKIEFRNKSEKDHEKKQKLRKDYVDKKDKLDVAVKELNDLEKNKAGKNKIEDAKKKVESAEKKFNESKDNLEKAKIKEPSEVEMDMIRGVEKKAALDNTEGIVEKSTNDSTENPKENNSNYESKGDFSDKKEDLNKNDKSVEANVENKNDGVNKDLLDAISKKTAEKDNLAKKVDALEKKVNRQIDRLAEANKTIETSTDSQEKAKAERLAENIKNDLYGENGLVKECESAKNELDSLTNELKNDLDTIGSKFEKANESSETNTEKSTENSGHKRNFNTDFIDSFLNRYESFLNDKTKDVLNDLKVEFNKLNDTLEDLDSKFESVDKPIEVSTEKGLDNNLENNDKLNDLGEINNNNENPDDILVIDDDTEFQPNEVEEIDEENLIPIEEFNEDDLESTVYDGTDIIEEQDLQNIEPQEIVSEENVEETDKKEAEISEEKRIESIKANPNYTDTERAMWIMSGEKNFEDIKLYDFDKMMKENPDNLDKFETIYKSVVDYDKSTNRDALVQELSGDGVVDIDENSENLNNDDKNIDGVVRDEMEKYARNYKDLPIDFSQVKNSRDLKAVCRFGDFFLNLEKKNPHAGLSEIDTHKVSLVEKRDEDYTEYNFFRNDGDKCNLVGVSGCEYVFEFNKSIIDNKISDKNYEGNICDFLCKRLEVTDMKLASVYEINSEGIKERLDFSKLSDTEKVNVISALAAMIENEDKADEIFDKSELLETGEETESKEDVTIENDKDVTENDDEIFDDVNENNNENEVVDLEESNDDDNFEMVENSDDGE